MAEAAIQPSSIDSSSTAKPAVSAVSPSRDKKNRDRALQILSKSIYKELRENGYEPRQIVSLASEIISLVTTDLGPLD